VDDLGDSPVAPWQPDRANPQAQNLQAILETVQTTTKRVADALVERDRIALMLGGDCTVGIGTVAGIQQAIGPVALAYFDLHSDLNIPLPPPGAAGGGQRARPGLGYRPAALFESTRWPKPAVP
jgi:arginase